MSSPSELERLHAELADLQAARAEMVAAEEASEDEYEKFDLANSVLDYDVDIQMTLDAIRQRSAS